MSPNLELPLLPRVIQQKRHDGALPVSPDGQRQELPGRGGTGE